MNTQQLLRRLQEVPFFTMSHLVRLTGKRPGYLKVFLHRLNRQKRILRIERNKYTVHRDPMMFATHLVWPSYLSGWQALRHHNLTEQLPTVFEIMTPKKRKTRTIRFLDWTIKFVTTKQFFGYRKSMYRDGDVFVAEPEKAILDSAYHKSVSFSELSTIMKANIARLNRTRFLSYLLRFDNNAMLKRFGYLLDSLGYDYHSRLGRRLDRNVVKLDPFLPGRGRRNDKWRVIVNT